MGLVILSGTRLSNDGEIRVGLPSGEAEGSVTFCCTDSGAQSNAFGGQARRK